MRVLSREMEQLIRKNPEIIEAMHKLIDSGLKEIEIVLKDGKKIKIKESHSIQMILK